MEYISTKEAAKRLGVSYRRLLALIESGRLPAQKLLRDWFILPEDLKKVEYRPYGAFKLTREQIAEIKRRGAEGEHPNNLAQEFGVSPRTIYRHISK
jgi:excisionase family DNA binding protein